MTHGLGNVDDGDTVLVLGVVEARSLGYEGPYLLYVDGGAEVRVLLEVEHSHTVLSKVARVASHISDIFSPKQNDMKIS
jgi:hypothetical protein